ncbi:MAG: AAA family ATPase [Acetobacteraceae bacterium]|nr:AAA family ATPase [Acetobacteraceae bacterium]
MPDDAGFTVRDAPEVPGLRVVTAAELLTMDLPARQHALAPVLPLPGLAMLYAPRGMGKTFAALSMAYAMAAGGTALKWRAPEPRRVFYIDGEMPAGAVQERLAQIIRGAGLLPPEDDYLRFACADLHDTGFPNIARREGQEAVTAAMGNAEVLILDNLSTLAAGLRENEADDWGGLQSWLLSLRRAGKHVLLIHHAGKSGQQRGTSRREDALDTVIALRKPSDGQPSQGARFEVHIEKTRGITGKDTAPFMAALVPNGTGGLTWAVSDLADAQRDRAVELLQAGMSIRDVAEETGLTRSTVHRLKQRQEGRPVAAPCQHAEN